MLETSDDASSSDPINSQQLEDLLINLAKCNRSQEQNCNQSQISFKMDSSKSVERFLRSLAYSNTSPTNSSKSQAHSNKSQPQSQELEQIPEVKRKLHDLVDSLKTPPKRLEDEGPISLSRKVSDVENLFETLKGFDVHQALLTYLKSCEDWRDFEYLCNALGEPDLHIQSDGPRGVFDAETPPSLKRTTKGNLKKIWLPKWVKSTLIQDQDVDHVKEVKEFFQNLKQQTVILNDRTYLSSSTHSSLITDNTSATGSQELTEAQENFRQQLNRIFKDKTLLFQERQDAFPNDWLRKNLVDKIEDIFIKVLEQFQTNKPPEITYKNNQYQFLSKISFNKTASRRRFCLVLYLLDKIRKLLINDVVITKREIYYQLKDYVSRQSVTDDVIMIISQILQAPPWDLNILAQRGLIYGNLVLHLANGQSVNCNVPGVHIPINIKEITGIDAKAYFILVVEKESVFHQLIEEDLPNKLTRPFILITGVGFPGHSTQFFLKKLWMSILVPVFILVDPDPHGVQIMLTYRFGGMRNAHIFQYMAIPKAQWLGVFPSEIEELNIPNRPLTEKDQLIVRKQLQMPQVKNNPKIQKEIEVFLATNRKGDIEGLLKSPDYLSKIYLTNKFTYKNFF